jgi:hypothetical protein
MYVWLHNRNVRTLVTCRFDEKQQDVGRTCETIMCTFHSNCFGLYGDASKDCALTLMQFSDPFMITIACISREESLKIASIYIKAIVMQL